MRSEGGKAVPPMVDGKELKWLQPLADAGMLPAQGAASCIFWPEGVSNFMLARSTNNLKLAGKSAQLIEKAISAWVCVIRSM